jgi:hypothetical protein
MRLILLIGLGLAFLLNSVILTKIYPGVSTNWDEYIKFVSMRNNVYEVMFALFFWLTYLSSERGSVLRFIACALMILAAGSVIDKCFFGITTYLKSDILLIILSIVISTYGYFRERKQRN